MRITLSDMGHAQELLPLTYTRPIAAFRVGITTIAEKYTGRGHEVGYQTQDYLQAKFPGLDNSEVVVYGGVCPTDEFLEAVTGLAAGEGLTVDDKLVAYKGEAGQQTPYNGELNVIWRAWDVFSYNAAELEADFTRITAGRTSAPIHESNTLIGDRVFLEEGAEVYGCTLNSLDGPVYVGKNALIMEGSVVRNGLAMCAHSVVKMGAKIYGATTLGPYCKVGGELNNAVLFAYSNKGHEGFLGNAVLGEWCNIGADTNNSNLKNNYDQVRSWTYDTGRFTPTGLQFCGLIMGDHSKTGINTMLNTGTVVGVSANIYGAGFPRNFIASFTWGGAQGIKEYRLNAAFDTAERMMARRGIPLDEVERKILEEVYSRSAEYRR